MASILAFAGSNSSTSINYQLVKHTSTLLKEHKIDVMDMSKFYLRLYSEDIEKTKGFPNELSALLGSIKEVDALIISVTEHNSGFSAFFKNLIDWLSRLERKFLENKTVLLMATSPGGRGGTGSLQMAEALLPRFGAEIVATFSLPSFYENFDANHGIKNDELKKVHLEAVNQFLDKI